MEHKIFPAILIKVDTEAGVVEHIVAVMGNVDGGSDIIHNGAFTKTIAERGGKVRCLDQHQSDSVLRVLGRPALMREIGQQELPPELLAKFPAATGGLWVRTQFNMKTQAGHDVFQHIAAGDVDEYSIGYDALDVDYTKMQVDGHTVTVRNLRTIRLWEYSPVIWGMNTATLTLDAKNLPADKAGRPVINKAVNLNSRIDEVVTAFYTQFPDYHDPDRRYSVTYWCYEVWDEFIIIRQEGSAGQRLWKVPYVVNDGGVQFALPDDWIEVTQVYVPVQAGMMTAVLDVNEKSGRVQSRRNAARLRQVRKLIEELLTDAGIADEDEEDDDKHATPPLEGVVVTIASEAGSTQSPTIDDRMLKLVETYLDELDYDLMEE